MQQLQRTTKLSRKDKRYKFVQGQEYLENEVWMNDTYTVFVRRNQKTPLVTADKKPVTMCWLSIKRNDNQAKPDWRDFQWIKNQLVGEENEGCELFPAENRLVDGANQFHLWVFEQTEMFFPFGFFDGRVVSEKNFMGETQRKFPANRKPTDLAEQEKKIEESLKKLDDEHTEATIN